MYSIEKTYFFWFAWKEKCERVYEFHIPGATTIAGKT